MSFKIFAADLPNGRGNFFLSSLRGIILRFYKMPKMGAKNRKLFLTISCLAKRGSVCCNKLSRKAWQRLLISCLGVPFYVTAVIQFFGMAVHQSGT